MDNLSSAVGAKEKQLNQQEALSLFEIMAEVWQKHKQAQHVRVPDYFGLK